MIERVPSDHPSVTTVGARVARRGGTRRSCLRLPAELALDGSPISVVIDGQVYDANVVEDATGYLLQGAYDNRRLARTPGEGENRLVAWLETVGRSPGSSVEVDEVEPGFFYGVRVPGTRVVYDVPERPSSSLSAIAERLEERE
ncbi:MAG: DUF7112 family protein [Halobacteriota archaeon]